jgi:hypothetical protein
LDDLTGHRGQIAEVNTPRRTVDGDPLSLVNPHVADGERAMLEVDLQLLAPDDRALAHAAGDDGGVARHSTARRQHRARGNDAVKVLRRGLIADEDHALSLLRPMLGDVGIEYRDAAGRAGTRRQAGGDWLRPHRAVDDGVEKLVELVGRDPAHGRFLIDQSFIDHFIGDSHGGRRRALAGSGL